MRHSEGLAGVLVASADGQAFRQPLEDIARSGVAVQVLGFREHASWALASDTLDFVDLEDIPGVFREPLPRVGLRFATRARGVAAAVPTAVVAADRARIGDRVERNRPDARSCERDIRSLRVRLVGSNGLPLPVLGDRGDGRVVPDRRRLRGEPGQARHAERLLRRRQPVREGLRARRSGLRPGPYADTSWRSSTHRKARRSTIRTGRRRSPTTSTSSRPTTPIRCWTGRATCGRSPRRTRTPQRRLRRTLTSGAPPPRTRRGRSSTSASRVITTTRSSTTTRPSRPTSRRSTTATSSWPGCSRWPMN